MSKEVEGFSAEYGYGLEQCTEFFANVVAILARDFYQNIIGKIEPKIAADSMLYIKKDEDIKHNWSEERAQSIHETPGKPKWSRTVKSIKDNIFS